MTGTRFAACSTANAMILRRSASVRLTASLALLIIIPVSSFAGVFVSVNIAPPVLPVYEQPPCPGDGYLWTPGYWAYGPVGYYWVPGVWVQPPHVGVLWTPGYWGFGGGIYAWHPGYWGLHVGFYGGINYGFGYFGNGYEGGYWRDRHFYYNRTVNNVTITNVHIYNKTVRRSFGLVWDRASVYGGVTRHRSTRRRPCCRTRYWFRPGTHATVVRSSRISWCRRSSLTGRCDRRCYLDRSATRHHSLGAGFRRSPLHSVTYSRA